MLIDPRPYTYEYRKPRYSNPTFQSRNLYQSLYHRYPYQSNDYFNHREKELFSSPQKPQRNNPQPKEYRQLERNLSEVRDRRSAENAYFKSSQQIGNNPERQYEGYKLPSINQNVQRARAQSNLGTNFTPPLRNELPITQRKQGFERFSIYERQQKPFNIISFYPKENENNKLRNFPKLTLEDKLIERGSYHTFRDEKL